MSYHGYGSPGMFFASGGGSQGMSVPMQLPKDVLRLGEQSLWSAYRYASGAALANTQQRVFGVALGNSGQGFAAPLTIAETNMKESGRIPTGYAYDCQGVACQPYTLTGETANTIYPLVGADARNIMGNAVLQWAFQQSVIDIAPVSLIGQGGGLFGATADTGAAEGGSGGTRTMVNNGNGQLWVYQAIPVGLPSSTTFTIQIAWGANAITVDGGEDNYALVIRVHLLGIFKMAIETA